MIPIYPVVGCTCLSSQYWFDGSDMQDSDPVRHRRLNSLRLLGETVALLLRIDSNIEIDRNNEVKT